MGLVINRINPSYGKFTDPSTGRKGYVAFNKDTGFPIKGADGKIAVFKRASQATQASSADTAAVRMVKKYLANLPHAGDQSGNTDRDSSGVSGSGETSEVVPPPSPLDTEPGDSLGDFRD